jgi:hypothetical protein
MLCITVQVAGPIKAQKRVSCRVQAVRSNAAAAAAADRQADSWASIAATGALTALVAATTLLSGSAAQAGADLALGKQVSLSVHVVHACQPWFMNLLD